VTKRRNCPVDENKMRVDKLKTHEEVALTRKDGVVLVMESDLKDLF
jgi:hypothetical protein